ncbi:CDP-glycerol glycerophosphotransferase family protein [Vagococcus fluvialis]|uniref:CDP-glycerol glycerophosphotransferase family protein n=1 Tax=Vagococcus fluvialis TaxID=2738 RepID=UPI003799E900
MIIDVQNNTFIINFETANLSEIKLDSKNEKIYTIDNNQLIITTDDLKFITDNQKAFVSISYLSDGEWIPFNIENTKMAFKTRTEIIDNETTYTCYIGGDKKLKIFNEGFISNKTILEGVMLNKIEKINDSLIFDLSLSTKYFQPTVVNLFLRDRKTKKQLIVSSSDIQVNNAQLIPNSFAITYESQASFSVNNKDISNLLNSIYNPDEPFFNWIDFYYNFEIKEYTTSTYAFRVPTTITNYSEDFLFEYDKINTCLLKSFGTENNYFSLNYYIYETKEITYFIEQYNVFNSLPKMKDEKPIIIVGEYYNTARDNGLAIFKYLVTHHQKDFQIYYGISKNSPDIKYLEDYKNNIRFIGSKEYTDIFLSSEIIIHSHFSYYLCPFSTKNGLDIFKEKECYFIQHGIILQKDVSALYSFDNHHFFDYFITSSERESKLIENKYNFPTENILEFGLPRFDNLFTWKSQLKKLFSFSKNKHFFAFFTWRANLNQLSNEAFIDSEYYKNIQKLINDSFWLDNPNLTLTLRFHRNLEKYIHLFSTNNKNVFISTEDDVKSIQNYIIDSDVMITDYSSAALDFAIMSKPVIYYLGLAENKNEDESYQKYLPGEIIESYDKLINSMKLLSNQRKNQTKFEDKLDDIYSHRDNKASYRLVEHIKKNTKRS